MNDSRFADPAAVADLASRADLARLLAACHYEPSAELAEEGVFAALLAAAGHADPRLAEAVEPLGAAFAAQPLEDLLVDYTQLFLGPVQAPAAPYGSVWIEGPGALMRDSTVAAQRCYEAGGFDLAEEFRDLPDHVAAELEFVYQLLFREAAALKNGEPQVAAVARSLRERFLREHLGRWMPAFAAAVETHARTAFYPALARATAAFVANEAARDGIGGG